MDNFKEALLDFRDDTLDFIDDNRKKLIIISFIAIIILLLLIILIVIFNPVKITISNVNEEMGNIIGTRASELELKAIAKKNGSELKDAKIEWSVDAGKVIDNGDGTIRWKLPTDEGTYTITAKTEKATQSKTIAVIGNDLSNQYKEANYQILFQDTDGDGLTDIYEGSTSKTSQNSVDTDNDGLNDGDEIIMELDPLKPDSKDDGVSDGERRLEYTFKQDNITMKMVGNGNFTQTSVDKYPTETLDNVASVIDGVYAFYTQVKLDSAEITIKYDKSKIKGNIKESKLAVYELDEENNTFTKLDTKIDQGKSTATFTVNDETLGKYFIADTSKLTSNLATEVVFLIDNSGSMYPVEEVSDSEENDVNFKRVDVVNELIDRLQGNYRFGAGKFTFEYKELVKLSSDKTAVKNSITTMKTDPESFTGTYVGAALEGGLEQFSDEKEQNRRYIVLISDGEDTGDVDGYDNKLFEEQIEVAKEKGVKIYTVGLGSVIDEKNLTTIASETKGKYYFAATADDLEVIFKEISADLNYNLYDTDNDDKDDAVVLADSGFLVGRDGFSFSNFSNSQEMYGYAYGMVLYAKMMYEDTLPSSLGARKITLTDGTVVEAPPSKPTNINSSNSASDITTLRTYKPVSLTVLSDLPADFWNSKTTNNNLALNSAHKKELQNLGFSFYSVPYNVEKAPFKNYEAIRFDMTNYLAEEEPDEAPLDDADMELLRTLSRFDIAKYRDEKFNFYDNNDTAFKNLCDRISDGEPVMLRINDTYTVLAVKVLADAKNMNKYKIEVYDPNYSGIEKYIDVERYKFSDIKEISSVITDEYEYKFSYQGTNVGVCLSVPNVNENL